MKKLFLGLLMFIPSLCFSAYYDLQHYTVIPDTINVTNNIYYRGNFNITSDTYTVRLASCTQNVIFYSTGTVHVKTLEADSLSVDMPLYLKKTEAATTYISMTGTGYFKGNGSAIDFSIDSSSASFNDALYGRGGIISTSYSKMMSGAPLYFGDTLNMRLQYDNATSKLRIANAGDTYTYLVVHNNEITLSTATYIKTNGTNTDFSIDATSATFYDPVYLTTNTYMGGVKQISPQDYAVCITSPVLLGTGATLISPFRSYAYTISSATIRISGGTNVIGMIEQRAMATPDSAGTDIWTGDITATTADWIGGTANDFTVPANYGLFFVPTSVSGDVGRLMIKYAITRD